MIRYEERDSWRTAPPALPMSRRRAPFRPRLILSAVAHVPPALPEVRIEGPWLEDLFVNPLSCEVYAMVGRDSDMRPCLYMAGRLNEAGRGRFAEDFTAALRAFQSAWGR